MTATHLSKRVKIDHQHQSLSTIDKPLAEDDVGIQWFVNPDREGFSAVFKSVPADFMVKEVDLQGNLVHLTSTDTSNVPSPNSSQNEKKEEKSEEETYQEMEQLLGKDITDKVRQLFLKEVDEVLTEPYEDKEERTKVHQFFKTVFRGRLVTDTKDGCIRIVTKSGSGKKGYQGVDRRHLSDFWTSKGVDYCSFVLYKENVDTLEAINILSKKLRLRNPKAFGYAGTKDRKAITTQRVTAFRIKAERLGEMNRSLRGIMLGNFSYVKDQLNLGDLKGNHFSIVLRNVQGLSQERIESRMQSFREHGFINYFGMQRFGTGHPPTHEVGRALLGQQYEEATKMLVPDLDLTKENNSLRGSAAKSIYSVLKSKPNDFQGAINAIPRNLRMLYIHAFQSFVWNKMVSERFTKYGFNVVDGDLVMKEEVEMDNTTDELEAESTSFERIKSVPEVVRKEELEKYSIFDVVLPVPGHSVIFPEHDVAKLYKDFLHDSGVSFVKDFKERTLSPPGTYRRIMAKPLSCNWEFVHYEDDMLPLNRSDKDILEEQPQPQPSLTEGNKLAMKLELSLGSSQYATMAVREASRMSSAEMHF